MRLLLDTHIVISLLDLTFEQAYPQSVPALRAASSFVSAASLWEIAIKTRLGKLDLPVPLHEMEPTLNRERVSVIVILPIHVIADIRPDVATRDPFDRLLLAQAQIEGMRFVTVDRALADHPVTFR